jgi:peptidoglycan/LPS O-acetylase OafA/YrhL
MNKRQAVAPEMMQGQGQQRLNHLDGLRGVAALAVVAFHFTAALAPSFVPAYQLNAHWVAYTPLAVFWNGPFAVSVFFVLSGFVVANAALKRGDPLWIDVVIRYLRIAVPATFSVIFAWALLSAYPLAATELAARTGSPWLAFTYQGNIPSLPHALFNGTIGIFVIGGSLFNNVLWTMRPELIGSLVCFVVCLFPAARWRILISIAFGIAILLTRRFEYEGFVFGILLREAVGAGWRMRWPLAAMVVGLVVGSQSGDAWASLSTERWPAMFRIDEKGGIIYPIAALLVVYATIGSHALYVLLSSRVARFLGAVSFPIYLIHVPIIYTIFAAFSVSLTEWPSALFALVVVTLCAMFAMAYAIEVLLERPLLRSLGSLRRALRDIRLRRPAAKPTADVHDTI